MAKYKGKSVEITAPCAEVFQKISHLGAYKEMLDSLPEQYKTSLSGVEFTDESILIDAPGVGKIELVLEKAEPNTYVAFTAKGSPIPMLLTVDLKEASESSTLLLPAIDINIPDMLKPFIGNKLQLAADKFGELFTTLFN